jgi:hypothetical protein
LSGLFDRDAFTTAIRRLAFIGAFLLGLSVPLLNSSIPAWTGFPIRREIARVISPDGREDAVLTEERAKVVVFSRILSQVRIVRHWMGTEGGSLVLSADPLASAQLVWTEPRLLEIRYNRARVIYFTNRGAAAPKERDWPIEIRLAPRSDDFSYLRPALDPKGLAQPPKDDTH